MTDHLEGGGNWVPTADCNSSTIYYSKLRELIYVNAYSIEIYPFNSPTAWSFHYDYEPILNPNNELPHRHWESANLLTESPDLHNKTSYISTMSHHIFFNAVLSPQWANTISQKCDTTEYSTVHLQIKSPCFPISHHISLMKWATMLSN